MKAYAIIRRCEDYDDEVITAYTNEELAKSVVKILKNLDAYKYDSLVTSEINVVEYIHPQLGKLYFNVEDSFDVSEASLEQAVKDAKNKQTEEVLNNIRRKLNPDELKVFNSVVNNGEKQ